MLVEVLVHGVEDSAFVSFMLIEVVVLGYGRDKVVVGCDALEI
jgi:hypothetical protein